MNQAPIGVAMGIDSEVERPSTLATGSPPGPPGSKSRSPWNGCCLAGVVVATLLTAAGVVGFLWWFHGVHTRTSPNDYVQVGLNSFVSFGCGDTIPGTGCVSRTGPSYISKAGLGQHFNLSVISDEDKRDTVLSELATNPGPSVFGDHGYQVNGFGGIFTYEVVQVDPPKEVSEAGSKVRLYGLRNYTPQSWDDPWFVDERAWNNAGSWADYSNSVALTCWNYSIAIRCDVEMGAKLVIGSGAWRNTTKGKGSSSCDFFPPERGIRSPQTADPASLQYIMNPTKEHNVKSKGCCVAPVAYDDVSKSFDKGCDPVDFSQGRELGAAPDVSAYARLRALQEHHRHEVAV